MTAPLITPLTERTMSDVRAVIDRLHADRERYDRANRIVEIRSCELEIAEATRALAILNRRATEADDQRRAEERAPDLDAAKALIADGRAHADTLHRMSTTSDFVATADAYAWLRANVAALLDGYEQALAEVERLRPFESEPAKSALRQNALNAEINRLTAQREADLREAFLAGVAWLARGAVLFMPEETQALADVGATDYARAKVGG